MANKRVRGNPPGKIAASTGLDAGTLDQLVQMEAQSMEYPGHRDGVATHAVLTTADAFAASVESEVLEWLQNARGGGPDWISDTLCELMAADTRGSGQGAYAVFMTMEGSGTGVQDYWNFFDGFEKLYAHVSRAPSVRTTYQALKVELMNAAYEHCGGETVENRRTAEYEAQDRKHRGGRAMTFKKGSAATVAPEPVTSRALRFRHNPGRRAVAAKNTRCATCRAPIKTGERIWWFADQNFCTERCMKAGTRSNPRATTMGPGPVPPKSLDVALDWVKSGGRLCIPTAYALMIITQKDIDAWAKAGRPLLRARDDGYQMQQRKGSVYLVPGQLRMID